jgi:IS1 family transposase
MITADEIEQEFRQRLSALLQEFGAELTAEDHWSGYAECGQDVRMTVEIPSVYDPETREYMREMTIIDLGRWVK